MGAVRLWVQEGEQGSTPFSLPLFFECLNGYSCSRERTATYPRFPPMAAGCRPDVTRLWGGGAAPAHRTPCPPYHRPARGGMPPAAPLQRQHWWSGTGTSSSRCSCACPVVLEGRGGRGGQWWLPVARVVVSVEMRGSPSFLCRVNRTAVGGACPSTPPVHGCSRPQLQVDARRVGKEWNNRDDGGGDTTGWW